MTLDAPLAGRTVLVTRGVAKGDRLGQLLEELGAAVVRVPLIATERLMGAGLLGAALGRLLSGDGSRGLVLTSQTGAGCLADELDGRSLGAVAVAAVGPATASALRDRGITSALVARGQTAAALAGELIERGAGGARVLVVAAAGGRDDLVPRLRGAGAAVELVEPYRSVVPDGAPARLRAALLASPPDAVTFTSGSTVRHFSLALEGAVLPRCPAICIGPVTAAVATELGWATVATAEEHTAPALAALTAQVLGAERLR